MIPFNDTLAHQWMIILDEIGYVGFKKGQIRGSYDERFGEENWSEGHYIDGIVCPREMGYAFYEDGYYHFLKNNQDVLAWLVSTASEVYDIDSSNVNSGLDYSIQECDATHLQDISVRRVLKRLVRTFEGDHLVQIRGRNSEGFQLNPGKVPFHRPALILPSSVKGWWDEGSIEDFYQSNKALIVNPEVLLVSPEIEGPEEVIYHHDRQNYYLASLDNPRFLTHLRGRQARHLGHSRKDYRWVRGGEMKPYSHFMQQTSPNPDADRTPAV